MSDFIETFLQETVLVEEQVTTTVEIVNDETIATVEEVLILVSEAAQGPQGIQGLQGIKGDPGGSEFIRIAGAVLSGHRAVLIDSQGLLQYATALDVTHGTRVVGITAGSSAQGDSATVIVFGEVVEPSWNWNALLPIYLGADGYLTQVVPEFPSKFSLVVGFPISNTTLFVNVQQPINLS